MNFDLLRPFDLEAAKRGDKLTRIASGEGKYAFVADAGPDGSHAIRDLDAVEQPGRRGRPSPCRSYCLCSC